MMFVVEMWHGLTGIFAGKHVPNPDDERAVKFVPDGYNSWRVVWADDCRAVRRDTQKTIAQEDLSARIFGIDTRLSTKSILVVWSDRLIKEAQSMKRNQR